MGRKRVLVVGGGFAGLAAAHRLDPKLFEITLLDQNNYHLFQPLLYQVATGSLGAPDIATPLRMIVKPAHVRVVQEQVVGVDAAAKVLRTASGGSYSWDILILALGLGHSYFGHDEWAQYAPSLKYLEDAYDIRNRILSALELAELSDGAARERALRFVVVGGGPTGVELAGAIGELTGRTLAREFASYDPRNAEILLLEAGPRILPQYDEAATAKAVVQLNRLGVTVQTATNVLSVDATGLQVADANKVERRIDSNTVIWAAGASATLTANQICQDLQIPQERGGRVRVDQHFRVPNYDDLFVLGDLASYTYKGNVLPGLAPVAERSGDYIGRYLNGESEEFEYADQGQLAVIGRNAAVGRVFGREVSGVIAWWLWLVVHIRGLIGFDAKLKVMLIWAWKFIFNKYGARIISGRRQPKE